MKVKVFNNLEEIQKYYDKDKNAYIFKEDGKYIDLVIFEFDLRIKADIYARNIKAHHIFAWDISAWNITAWDINAYNIEAWDIIAWNIKAINIEVENIFKSTTINARYIRYHDICLAYSSIKCQSIKGRRDNAKYFVLDGKIEMLENGELCEKDQDRLEKLEQENKELKEQVNRFEKIIEDMKNPSKLDCTHMFDNCKKLTPLTEKKEHKMTSKEGLKLLETRCRFFAQDDDELQETYEAREAIKKDLELLDIIKSLIKKGDIVVNPDLFVDYPELYEWLEQNE